MHFANSAGGWPLDGVMQAPGGPTEDPIGNFTLSGWLFAFEDAGMDLSAAGFDGKDRELVLGRKTYEIFEAYWPYQSEDDPIARTLNAAKKHVASRTLKSLQWNNSSVLGGDIVSAITALKVQPGHDLQIMGSGNLIQTLQAASLIALPLLLHLIQSGLLLIRPGIGERLVGVASTA